MKRLLFLMILMAVSVNANAAKMSSYTDNTTPNDDVYFIGVDPNDTTQTVNGSNYRYSLSSILGSGLLDFNANSVTVSGSGDSWLELNNNASFSGSLVGKYGYSFLTANPTAIINGTTSRLALYSELGTTSITEGTATADPSTMSTGEIYIETDTGTTTIKTALGSVAISGTYTADLGIAPTLTSLTIPTSGATATAVFSEAMTVGSGGNGGWTLNTPTNAMTYASGSGTDTIVFNLASTIMDADTPTVSYTQPGDGWESNDDNVDLVTISGASVTNNSTQVSASIETLEATSDVTVANWTSTGANHYSVVADSSDATYTESAYYAQQLFFGLANTSAAAGKTINKITVKCRARNTNGTEIPSFRISTDSSSYNFALSGITSSWAEYSYDLTVNPKTSAAWTTAGNAGIDAMFIGFITANAANNTQVSKLWVEVDYEP